MSPQSNPRLLDGFGYFSYNLFTFIIFNLFTPRLVLENGTVLAPLDKLEVCDRVKFSRKISWEFQRNIRHVAAGTSAGAIMLLRL
jgi:hypothetical protein